MKTFFYALLFLLILPQFILAENYTYNSENVTIVRDTWGVPHIYGKTDADAVYGLSWAQAEDDFETMQETLLALRLKLGEVKGKEGALMDAFVFICDVNGYVDKHYEEQISDEFKVILEASALAINTYAETHPKEVERKGVFPIHGKDIVKGYYLGTTMLSMSILGIIRIASNKVEKYDRHFSTLGSNGLAFSKNKMKDNKTLLISNTHQPLEGIFSWREVHVNSEEGWNFLGANFPGTVSPLLGTNEHLGWTHTTNYPDFYDIYKLAMNPNEKLQYKYDGEWKNLQKRVLKIKVKIGPVRIPIKKAFYWSEYGVTLKNKTGFYSMKFAAGNNLGSSEQWYRMTKAKSYEEFQEVLTMQKIPCMNIVYADKEDNLMYMSNGLFPYRNPDLKFNWAGILEGNTSVNNWKPKFMPMDSIVTKENPNCGYLFNCNNTPFSCTHASENPNPKDYNKTINYLKGETNRSIRLIE